MPGLLDQFKLPPPLPFLQPSLASNRHPDIGVSFEVDEALHSISFGESWNHALAMFPCTPKKIACDTDVQRAIPTARHDVDEVSFRHPKRPAWMARVRGPRQRVGAIF